MSSFTEEFGREPAVRRIKNGIYLLESRFQERTQWVCTAPAG